MAAQASAPAAAAPHPLADRWLTAETAAPLTADGVVERDAGKRPVGYELIGRTVPDFTAPLVGGGETNAEALRGKWTVVDVWGIWCGDCRRDTPLVQELARAIDADPQVEFLSIHTPPNATRAAEAYGQFGSVEAYFAAEGVSYPTAIDADASLRGALKVRWTPSYLLVGPDLKVHAFRTDLSVGGEGNAEAALADVRALIARAGEG